MPVTLAVLRGYLNDTVQSTDEDLTAVLETATELVTKYVGTKDVPAVILDSAILETASKQYQKRNVVAGSFGDPTGMTVMAPRDPMITSYPMLDPFIGIAL